MPSTILFKSTTLHVTATEALKVTGLRWEGPHDEASAWIVCDLRVNGKTWLKAEGGAGIPLDTFALSELVRQFVDFGDLCVGDAIEIDVANTCEDIKVFTGAFIGTPL